MSERTFCFNQKWYRIYDSGTKVYQYILNKNNNLFLNEIISNNFIDE